MMSGQLRPAAPAGRIRCSEKTWLEDKQPRPGAWAGVGRDVRSEVIRNPAAMADERTASVTIEVWDLDKQES